MFGKINVQITFSDGVNFQEKYTKYRCNEKCILFLKRWVDNSHSEIINKKESNIQIITNHFEQLTISFICLHSIHSNISAKFKSHPYYCK